MRRRWWPSRGCQEQSFCGGGGGGGVWESCSDLHGKGGSVV